MKNYLKLVCVAFLTVFMSCDSDDDATEQAAPGLKVAENATFGKMIVDQDNRSLYFFANDITGERLCSGGCLVAWPPFIGDPSTLEFGAGLNSSDFSYITVNGLKHVTYKGWPLYYFAPGGEGELEPAGEVNGDGKNGVFYVAKPDYSLLLGKQVVGEGDEAVTYLVDESGVTLYLNTNDGEDISNCAGGCAQVWPPFESPQYLTLPSILDENDFTTVTRTDGLGAQLSYKGSPIYLFASDEENRGSVLGQGGGPAASFFVIEPEQ